MTHRPPASDIADVRALCGKVLDKRFDDDTNRLHLIAIIDPTPMGVHESAPSSLSDIQQGISNRDVLRLIRRSLEEVKRQQQEFRSEVLESASQPTQYADNKRGRLLEAEIRDFEDRKITEVDENARLYAAINTLCNTLEDWELGNLFFDESAMDPKTKIPQLFKAAIGEAMALCVKQKLTHSRNHDKAVIEAASKVVDGNIDTYSRLVKSPKTAKQHAEQRAIEEKLRAQLSDYENPQSKSREYDDKMYAYYSAIEGALQVIAQHIEQLTKSPQGGMTR